MSYLNFVRHAPCLNPILIGGKFYFFVVVQLGIVEKSMSLVLQSGHISTSGLYSKKQVGKPHPSLGISLVLDDSFSHSKYFLILVATNTNTRAMTTAVRIKIRYSNKSVVDIFITFRLGGTVILVECFGIDTRISLFLKPMTINHILVGIRIGIKIALLF